MWHDIVEQFKKLAESESFDANTTFEKYLPPAQKDRLDAKFADKAATHEGQLEILHDAAQGDMDSALYLYGRYLRLTIKVFWKYYIGENRTPGLTRAENGGAVDVATKAFELLAGLNEPNPYATWKPEVYRDDPNVDLIKQFSYWYSRYLQNECVKLYKEEAKQGLAGKRFGDNVSVSSYDAYGTDRNTDFGDADVDAEFANVDIPAEDSVELADEPGSTDSFEGASDLKDVIRDFTSVMKSMKSPKFYTIFYLRLQGLSFKEISEETGMTRQEISVIWRKIQQMWIDRYPDTKDLLK